MYINHAINNSISSFRRDIFSRARLLQETYPTSSVNPTSVSMVNVPAFKRFREANNEYGVLAYDMTNIQIKNQFTATEMFSVLHIQGWPFVLDATISPVVYYDFTVLAGWRKS